MFIVLLKFSSNRALAPDHMAGHNAWLARGFDEGVFLIAGSIKPGAGGAIVAHDATREAVQARIDEDPFVVHDVVRAEILEIAPAKADPRLQFLVAGAA